MKTLVSLAVLAMFTAVLTTVTFAASKKDAGNFTLSDTVRVGSTQLSPGQYKAEWKEETGNTVKVDILEHGKTVATAEGKLKNLQEPAPYDAVVIKPLTNNAKEISEIDFSNRKQALVLGG
jgi:hypothetical protein